jgi:hypothetical protein
MNLPGILPEPQHYPMPLGKYGKSPFGEPIFRVVYAPSVRKIVGGKWPDGYIGYRQPKAYPHLKGWIIEKWLSAFDDTRMTESMYERQYKDEHGLLLTGPYPTRGRYVLCEELSGNFPTNHQVETIVTLLVKAKNNNPAQNAKVLLDDLDRQEKHAADERFDRCKEANPAFGIRAASFRGHAKATKSAPMPLTAEQAGLHVRGAKFGGNRQCLTTQT